MSVIVTITMKGDPNAFERVADENEGVMRSISERAQAAGVIAHRFYGSEDGQVMVVDEWPDAQSFQQFFASITDEVAALLQGFVQSEPVVTVWRTLRSHDEVGWEK
jgi:quinol monooxygenase YgiN